MYICVCIWKFFAKNVYTYGLEEPPQIFNSRSLSQDSIFDSGETSEAETQSRLSTQELLQDFAYIHMYISCSVVDQPPPLQLPNGLGFKV